MLLDTHCVGQVLISTSIWWSTIIKPFLRHQVIPIDQFLNITFASSSHSFNYPMVPLNDAITTCLCTRWNKTFNTPYSTQQSKNPSALLVMALARSDKGSFRKILYIYSFISLRGQHQILNLLETQSVIVIYLADP